MTRGPSFYFVDTSREAGVLFQGIQIRTADTLNYKPELSFCSPNSPHINCAMPQNIRYFQGSNNGFHINKYTNIGFVHSVSETTLTVCDVYYSIL